MFEALARSTKARARKQQLQAACDAVDAELRSSADEMKVVLAGVLASVLTSVQKAQAVMSRSYCSCGHDS